MGRLFTVPQVAQILQVKSSTVYTWIRQGKFAHIRAGRLIRFSPEQVNDFLRKGSHGSLPPDLGDPAAPLEVR